MNLLRKLVWRRLSRAHQQAMLGTLPAIQQLPLKRTLFSKHLALPEAFLRHQCIFIHVPKCAGKSMALSLFGDAHSDHLPLDWYARQFPDFYAGAFRFAVVRDPLERAYSAYRYLRDVTRLKVDQPARRMVQRFDGFDDFIQHWLCAENARRQILYTPQWMFLTDAHGFLDVDYLGRYETLSESFARICQRLGIESRLEHVNSSGSTAEPIVDQVAPETVRIIREVYWRDYQLFDYLPPEIVRP